MFSVAIIIIVATVTGALHTMDSHELIYENNCQCVSIDKFV